MGSHISRNRKRKKASQKNPRKRKRPNGEAGSDKKNSRRANRRKSDQPRKKKTGAQPSKQAGQAPVSPYEPLPVGYLGWVRRPGHGLSEAEVLSVRRKRVHRVRSPQVGSPGPASSSSPKPPKTASGGKDRLTLQKTPSLGDQKFLDRSEYYVHYTNMDRRMDEWIPRSAFEEKVPRRVLQEKVEKKKKSSTPGHDPHDPHHGIDQQSLEAHNEATKVKNVDAIIVGRHRMETWYFSPVPQEYRKYRELYFCDFCLEFFGLEWELERHNQHCTLFHPPGNEVYRTKDGRLSCFEVDGSREKQYCQNLCYIAKLFLDHKTLRFDTDPFLFYILCEVDETGCHLVAYFSKEKFSREGFNLACILTLPAFQRNGYGRFLMSLSYELSKLERKIGTPETPLSDLGRVTYEKFWRESLLEVLTEKDLQEISLKDIQARTAFRMEDIKSCLQSLGILSYREGKHQLVLTDKLLKPPSKRKRKPLRCNPSLLRISIHNPPP